MKATRNKSVRNGNKTAAYLIKMGVDTLRQNPEQRVKLGIDLLDLQLAETVKRRLLRELRRR